MSLNIGIGIQNGDRDVFMKAAETAQQSKKEQNEKGLERKTLYAGDTALAQEDSVLAKKIKAQKDALKELMDQHAREAELDTGMEEMETRRGELAEEAAKALGEVDTVREMRKAYQEEYGVTRDTPEELLPQDESYETAMKQFDEMEEEWLKRAADAMEGRAGIGRAMDDILVERAKTHPMVDAAKNADEILENAGKEIIGMLQQEAVEQIDEKMQDTVEEAEKIPLDDLQNKAQMILREEALLPEDLLGIAVDTQT